MDLVPSDYQRHVRNAVSHFWDTLGKQSRRQKAGDADRGKRAGVTGGKQMDGFIELVRWLLNQNGMPASSIHTETELVLPGYYRPTKKWDLLVIYEEQLVAAIEFKSQTSPSFGKNFNNRAEEAIGTTTDLWEAYKNDGFGLNRPFPWVGWLMLLEDCRGSLIPRKADKSSFKILSDFHNTSFADRYAILLKKLVLHKLVNEAALLMSKKKTKENGIYLEPFEELAMKKFLASLAGHVRAFTASL